MLEYRRSGAIRFWIRLLHCPTGKNGGRTEGSLGECHARSIPLWKAGEEKSATARLPAPMAKFLRYKVTDPSFHNWFGLALALRGQQISDFPLCNKSFQSFLLRLRFMRYAS